MTGSFATTTQLQVLYRCTLLPFSSARVAEKRLASVAGLAALLEGSNEAVGGRTMATRAVTIRAAAETV